MSTLKLIVGNKRYSSWSMRAGVTLAQLGVPYEEELIKLDKPDTAALIAKVSPGGRVPALLDGDLTVWDSLAINEYLAEKFPRARLWPEDAKARAVARSVCAEMHSGFAAMRSALSMDLKKNVQLPLTPEVRADVDRVLAIWTDCRARFGAGGPLLFGHFTIADAFYAPVVARFRSYGVQLDGAAKAYADAVWSLGSVQRWVAAGLQETFIARYHSPEEAAAPGAAGGSLMDMDDDATVVK